MGAVAAEAPAGGGGVHACVRERERETRVLGWPLEAKPRLILSLMFPISRRVFNLQMIQT